MARIPDAFIDDLLARTDIVEVIGTRVPLKRQGKEYSARCPFHDERSPSFTVSQTKQFYHCFGCGAHGTAISFLMNYDRLEFLDAVDELAKRVGMEVPKETRARNENDDSRDMYLALEATAKFYQRQLEGSNKAKEYLDQRGVDESIRAQFSIGYAPDGFLALKDTLGTDDRRLKLLERTGMLSKNDNNRVYDKFRDRVMFPIHDRRGRVIAFGGRVLDKDDGPKYLNSPETPLFHKGRELYGLWQVRQANQKIERLVVVEGYMDVVSLFQYGVTQAVATLGTATTPDHAELLFRNTPDVYFCFDGDRAGRSAAWKAVESILPRMREERQAFFLFLPDGEDPDTIVRSGGKDGFLSRLSESTPLSEFYFDQRLQGIKLTSFTGRAAFADRCKNEILSIPEGSFKDVMINRLKELSGLDIRKPNPVGQTGAARPTSEKPSLVRSAIIRLLHQPSLALSAHTPYSFSNLRLPGIPLLIELLELIQQRPDVATGALLEHFEGREELASLQKLAMHELPGEKASWQAEFLDAIEQLDKQSIQQRLEELQEKQRSNGLDEADKYELRALLQARIGRG